MLQYNYRNAIVYITKPGEKHLANIQNATKVLLKRVIKERIKNDCKIKS